MLKHTLGLALLAAPSLATANAQPAPPFCRVVIYTDYSMLGAAYYAVPQLAPGCPPNSVGRLRKSSTLNLKSQGAAFQPIRPAHGAWTVTSQGDDVPNSEQITFFFSTWRWEWYDGQRWLPADLQ